MRKTLVLSGVVGWAAILLAAGGITPLHVKTGLWESSTTSGARSGQLGLPPEAAARLTPEQRAKMEAAMNGMASSASKPITSRHCVTEDQLTKDPFSDKGRGDRQKCDQTVINSSASSLDLREACTEGSSKVNAHITLQALDSEHVKGTVQSDITMGGRTMHQTMSFVSKWVSASCPAGD